MTFSDFSVVCTYGLSDIRHARITQFDAIGIEYFAVFVLGEVFFQEEKKSASDICLYV